MYEPEPVITHDEALRLYQLALRVTSGEELTEEEGLEFFALKDKAGIEFPLPDKID
jgi:hypothetical protein